MRRLEWEADVDSCTEYSRPIVTGLTWVSGLLCVCLIFIEFRRERHKSFPTNLPLMFATVSLGLNMVLGIGPVVGFRQVTNGEADDDSDKYHDFWRGLCITQGILYQFFGTMTLYWYVTLTYIMHSIIVLNTRTNLLIKNERRFYILSILLPLSTTIPPLLMPLVDGGPIRYRPREGGIECWLNDSTWQLVLLYLWVAIAALYGAGLGYQIIKKLRSTSTRAVQSRKSGALQGSRGRTVLATLREHAVRAVFFLLLYVIFAFVNLLYFGYVATHETDDKPCAVTLLYSINTSLIGTYVACTYGVTRENIKMIIVKYRSVYGRTGRSCWRRFCSCCVPKSRRHGSLWNAAFGMEDSANYQKDEGKGSGERPLIGAEADPHMRDAADARLNAAEQGAGGQDKRGGDDDTCDLFINDTTDLDEDSGTKEGSYDPAIADVKKALERGGLGVQQQRANPQQQQQQQKPNVVTTHLGTKINVPVLGTTIKSPVLPCPSGFDSRNAVSGTSVPPPNHPMTVKMDAIREEYTRKLLMYVMGKVKTMKLDEALAKKYMEEVEKESHSLFDARSVSRVSTVSAIHVSGGLGGGEREDSFDGRGSDILELPSEATIEERVQAAKDRFDSIARLKKGER